MKIFRLHFLTLLITCNFLVKLHAGTFTSLASGAWNGGAGFWTVVGDADNIPDSDDDVTILAGHTMSLAGVSNCRDLILNAGAPGGTLLKGSYNLNIYGNLVNNGSFSGAGRVWFWGSGKTISGTTAFSNGSDWTFRGNTSIAAGVSITKTGGYMIVEAGVTVTNNGSVSFSAETINLNSATAVWTNAAGSSVTIKKTIVGSGTFNASASTNTVTISASSSVNVTSSDNKRPSSGNYNTLVLTLAGTKLLAGNLDVDASLTCSTGSLDINGQNVNLGGSWTQNSTVLSNTATVTFDGSASTQTVSGTVGSISFANITCNNTAAVSPGVTFSMPITISGTTTLTAGVITTNSSLNFNSGSTQSLTGGAGSLTAASTVTVTSGLTASRPVIIKGNLTLIAGVLTNSSNLTFNGTSGAQTIGGAAGTMTCASAGTLTIDNASGVTTGNAITINGTIIMNSGVFTTGATLVTVNLPVVATGGIGNSSGSVTGTNWVINQSIAPSDTGWQNISSPESNANISHLDATLKMSIDASCPDGLAGGWHSVYTYNTGTQSYTTITNCAEPMSAGQGFEIWLADDMNDFFGGTASTTGTPNIGNVPATVAAGVDNYSLIGNPYAYRIDVDAIFNGGDAPGLYDYIEAYDDVNHNYASWDNDLGTGTGELASTGGVISAYQGFWVSADAGAASLTFRESHKVATGVDMVKQAKPVETNILRMKIRSKKMPNAHESIIAFRNAAGKMEEPDFNVSFRRSRDEKSPSITPISENNKELTIAKYSDNKTSLDIPIVAKIYVPGEYMIDFKNVHLISAYQCMVLEEVGTNNFVSLTGDYTFRFNSHGTEDSERHFILHCKKYASDCNDIEPSQLSARVSSSTNGVWASFYFDEPTITNISVINVLGQELMNSTSTVFQEDINLQLPKSNSVYIVRIKTAQGTLTRKIIY